MVFGAGNLKKAVESMRVLRGTPSQGLRFGDMILTTQIVDFESGVEFFLGFSRWRALFIFLKKG